MPSISRFRLERRVIRTALLASIVAVATIAQAPAANNDAFTSEPSRAAGSFVDSIGVNVHLSYHDGPYGRYPRVNALLAALGVRHLRDGISLGQNDVCKEVRELGSLGIRFDYIVDRDVNAAKLTQWHACTGSTIESYEGLNEYDISHPASDPDWAATDRSVQRSVFRIVKSTPALSELQVIGPSLTSENAFRSVGDLSNAMDFGNMHNYFAGHEPGTGGWGLNGYGSIAWNLAAARITSGNRPVISTETGYSTGGDPHAVNPATQAVYVPEIFLEHFAARIPRTYYYQLLDEGGPPFSHYGLVDGNFAPKPAFVALRNLINLLADEGPASAEPSLPALRYRLENAAGVRRIVLSKRDGSIDVVLWQAAANFDPLLQRTLSVPVQPLTMRLATAFKNEFVTTFDARGMTQTNDVTRLGQALPLSLAAGPVVVRLVP